MAIFDHFIKFGLFALAVIAYLDRLDRFTSINRPQGVGKGHQLCMISIINEEKKPKMVFCAFDSCLIGSIGVIFHITVSEY